MFLIRGILLGPINFDRLSFLPYFFILKPILSNMVFITIICLAFFTKIAKVPNMFPARTDILGTAIAIGATF